MSERVPFFCPKHGLVLAAPVTARVEHDHIHCGEECAPEGVTPKEQRRKYATRRRVARHRA